MKFIPRFLAGINFFAINNNNRFLYLATSVTNCYNAHAMQYTCRVFSTKHQRQWRILFFGSDDFAVRSLQSLCSKLRTDTLINNLDVVTNVAVDWRNEHNDVYKFSTNEKLTVFDWPITVEQLNNNYDIGIVVSFGYLIPEDIIAAFPLGVLNVHASLLPRWRGAAPIIYAIMNGDTMTGVTVMKINPHKFDTGDIVRAYAVSISKEETTPELTSRLSNLGAKLLVECIRDLPRSVKMIVPQASTGVTYARKVTPSLAVVDWCNMTSEQVFNLHRALSHKYPLRTHWLEHVVKLHGIKLDLVRDSYVLKTIKTDSTSISSSIIPGLVEYSPSRSVLRVQCKDGKWVTVDKVTVLAKKTSMSAKEFLNGFLSKIPNIIERRFK